MTLLIISMYKMDLCQIRGSHTGFAEDWNVLEPDTTSFGVQFQTMWSSSVTSPPLPISPRRIIGWVLLRLLHREEDCNKILRNVGNPSSGDMASDPRTAYSHEYNLTSPSKGNYFYKVRSRVQKFPAWHTKAAPNGKCCEGYIVPSMARLMYQLKSVWYKGRLCWKIANLFYFCHLKKLDREETWMDPSTYKFTCYIVDKNTVLRSLAASKMWCISKKIAVSIFRLILRRNVGALCRGSTV